MKNGGESSVDLAMKPFRVGEWVVHPSLHRLEGQDRTIQIEPKLMDVLLCLAARPGEVVSRRDLLDQIWDDVIVGEEALTRAVSELRRVLGDDTQSPAYIETIRKGGYRLIAGVKQIEPGGGPGMGTTSERRPRRAGRAWWARLGVISILLVAAGYWLPRLGDEQSTTAPLKLLPLTSYAGTEQFPALSPDGSMVAFGWNGPGQDNMDIYVKQVGEETPLRLTDHPGWDTYPVWSPSGKSVTYIHGDDEGMGIYEVPLLGGEPRLILRSRHGILGFTWIDEGVGLVYADRVEPNGVARLYHRDLRTDENDQFLPHDEVASDMIPLISPNGQTIAFVRSQPSGDEQIYVVPAAGGEPNRLTEGLGTLEGLCWTRDSRSLIFSSAMSGSFSLWRVDVASGKISWVPVHGEWIFQPSAATGANRLAYQHRWFEKNIWHITRDEGASSGITTGPLISSTRWDCEACYSPDGTRLAFISARSGFLEIWTCLADGERPVQLTHFGGPTVATPRWSPDGSRISFTASPDGYSDLFVLEFADREMVRLTADGHNNAAPSWSADGRWLYFGSDRSGTWELWKTSVAGDGLADVQLTFEGGICGHQSTDGKYLYFTKKHEAGMWLLSLEPDSSGKTVERLIDDLPHLGDWNNWALWSGGLVLLDYNDQEPMLVRYDFTNGEASPVCSVEHIARPSLAVSPDGRAVLYARIENSVNDLVLVEGFK
jgi:Tol biopolymer transport system component/DNA-binding winged helix-turn-helix (wHTH) protein